MHSDFFPANLPKLSLFLSHQWLNGSHRSNNNLWFWLIIDRGLFCPFGGIPPNSSNFSDLLWSIRTINHFDWVSRRRKPIGGRQRTEEERKGWNAKNLRETEREEGPIEGAKNTFRGPSTTTMMTTMRNFLELKGFVEIFINKICRHQILPNSQNCPSCYVCKIKEYILYSTGSIAISKPSRTSKIRDQTKPDCIAMEGD